VEGLGIAGGLEGGHSLRSLDWSLSGGVLARLPAGSDDVDGNRDGNVTMDLDLH